MEFNLFIDLALVFIVFIVLFISSITDIKKREVPNWISFSFIALAIILKLIGFVFTFNYVEFLIFPLISFLILYLLGNLFYYGQIFGGGDIKLLFGMSIAFSSSNIFYSINKILPFLSNFNLSTNVLFFLNEPFIIPFIINSLFIGGIYGIFYCFFVIISSRKNQKIFYREFIKKIKLKDKLSKGIFYSFIIFSFICFILSFYDKIFLFFTISFLLLPFLFFSIKIIEDNFMIKSVYPKSLCEGDWIINNLKIKDKIIKKSVHGLSLKEIRFIQKNYNKKIQIKEGLPFVPVFLISLIISLVFGNLLIKFFYLFV